MSFYQAFKKIRKEAWKLQNEDFKEETFEGYGLFSVNKQAKNGRVMVLTCCSCIAGPFHVLTSLYRKVYYSFDISPRPFSRFAVPTRTCHPDRARVLEDHKTTPLLNMV